MPAVGNPNQLLLQYLAAARPDLPRPAGRDRRLQVGRPLDSLYPPGIPIGTVSNANQNNAAQQRPGPGHPAADLRHLDVVQILTKPQARHAARRRCRERAPPSSPSGSSRSAFVTVVLQQAAVSQISIFGVSADLDAAGRDVGRAADRLAARRDHRLRRSACSSTWCSSRRSASPRCCTSRSATGPGALRELRDPAHGLVPLALGAAATAFAGIGMALIQFLLGVDAPVSLLLVQQIFVTVLRQHADRAARLRGRAPGRCGRRCPTIPRRRRRRAYTTGGLSPLQRPSERLGRSRAPLAMIQLPEDRRPPLTPQLALRVGVLGSVALAMFAIIFFRLWFLQVLSGDKYVRAGERQPRAHDLDVAGAARGDPRPQRHTLVGSTPPSIAVQISPPDLPRRPRRAQRAVYVPASGVGARHLDRAASSARSRARASIAAARRSAAQSPSSGAAALRRRDDQDRRVEVRPVLPRRAPGRSSPGVSVQQVWLRHYPLERRSRAQLFGTVGPITPHRGQRGALPGRLAERDRRPVGPRVVLRPVPAGQRRLRAASRSTRSGSSRATSRRRSRSPATR